MKSNQKDNLGWLKEAIISYIQTHKNVDSVELVSYMKLGCDVTLIALRECIEEGKIDRYWTGRYYILRVIK